MSEKSHFDRFRGCRYFGNRHVPVSVRGVHPVKNLVGIAHHGCRGYFDHALLAMVERPERVLGGEA